MIRRGGKRKQKIAPETSIAPENRPLQKEIPIGNHHFWGVAMLVSGRVYQGSPFTIFTRCWSLQIWHRSAIWRSISQRPDPWKEDDDEWHSIWCSMMMMMMMMVIMIPTNFVDCVKLRSATLQEALLKTGDHTWSEWIICIIDTYFHTGPGPRTKATSFLIAGHFT